MADHAPELYDLVVIGGGLAGLVAGVRAVELGLRTVILEQGEGDGYACNSRQSGGILHILFHDPRRDPDELAGLIQRATGGDARPDLALALARTGGRLIDWMQAHGARFMRFNQQEGYRWCLAPPRAMRAGIDYEGRGPDIFLRGLARTFVDLGGRLEQGTRALELVMESGACVGVVAESRSTRRTWRSQNCLICDGGFQASEDAYREFVGPNFDGVFQRGARTGKGDGLRMARDVGAALVGTHAFYGHVLCHDARHNDDVWPYPELDALATAGIVVDRSGNRVVDEGRSGVFLANALATARGEGGFFVIFDQAIWDGPGTSARIPANPLLEKAGGTVWRAPTPEALALQIGVPAATLRESLDAYNAALDAGALDKLAVPRSTGVRPHAIRQGPFMAISLLPGITYTMGGIAIDGEAQVLDEHGLPIPGLLAAGATTGGLEGGRDAVYIGGLIKAGSFGLIAAERAAELKGVSPAKVADASAQSPARAVPASHLVSSASLPAHGLARYPLLRATLRFGVHAAIGFAVCAALLVAWLAWPALGLGSIGVAAAGGLFVAFACLSYVELIRLIVTTLISE